MQQSNLFDFINKLKVAYVSGMNELIEVIPVDLTLEQESKTFNRYVTGPFAVGDTLKVEDVDIRLRHGKSIPSLLGFDISGACITLEDLKREYQGLTITDIPRGNSLNAKIYYSSKKDENNLRLSFGFPEGSADCLRTIVIKTDR